MVLGSGPGGSRVIQYVLSFESNFNFRGSLPIAFRISPIGVIAPKNNNPNIIGFVNLLSNIPKWYQTLLKGDKIFGNRIVIDKVIDLKDVN